MRYNKGNVWVIVLIVIVVLGLGWWFFASRNDDGVENDIATTTVENGEVSLENDMIDEIFIMYGDDGFEPTTITINRGQTVRWMNQSGGDMWVASAMHPTHSMYPGSDIEKCGTDEEPGIFDQCENGAVFEFTFNEAGEWGYHNHSRATHSGKVIVQ